MSSSQFSIRLRPERFAICSGLSNWLLLKFDAIRPFAGDQLSVDPIIPFIVAPQLDKVIANLELMPLKLNIAIRAAAVAARQPKHREDSRRQIMRMHDPKGDMSVRREGVNKDTMGQRQLALLRLLESAGLLGET